MKKYNVIHKLTKKPIRDSQTSEVVVLDYAKAVELCELKNTIVGSDFYAVVEVV